MKLVELLLFAIRRGTAPDEWLRRAQTAGVDWDDLAVHALALGLAPLVQARLEAWGVVLAEPRAQAKLAFARQTEVARHEARTRQLAAVLDGLPVVPIVLKGAYLAEHVYPQPGLRPMNDIDLLFRPADLPVVEAALLQMGYGGRQRSPDQGPGITKHTSTFRKPESASAPNPYLASGSTHMIEPHRSLEESWFGLSCDLTPGMWERSVTAQSAGHAARALSPADNLLHLAVHLTFHLIMGSPSFVQLADIAMFLEHVPVDWDDFLARALERRAAGYACAALRLAHGALNAPIPPGVLARLAHASPPRARKAADQLTVTDMMRRTQRPPLRTIAQRLRRGIDDRAETARWAQSVSERARVWWTLVDFRRTDTWRLLRGK